MSKRRSMTQSTSGCKRRKEKRKIERSTKKQCSILYISSFIISLIPALFYTAPAFEDGLGTMAAAAFLTGRDWSGFLAADGYYYKYGQALWYFLPFLIVDDAVIRYKIMLIINSALTALIPVIIYHITITYRLADRSNALWIALLTGGLPSILLYNKYTWAETNLFVIPWLILLLQLKLCMADHISRRDKMICSAGIAILAVYAFMSHQRGMIIVIATTIVVIWIGLYKKEGYLILLYLLTLGLGLGVDHFISIWQKASVYAGAELMHNTLADFLKPEIYQKMITRKGMSAMFYPFVGWLYNCTCSTFGVALVGLGLMISFSVQCIRKKRFEEAQDMIAVQGVLCFLGAFALGLLFFFQSSYGYLDGTQVERGDHLLFGRYLESSVPVLFYLGLIGMERSGGKQKGQYISIIVQIGMFLFVSVKLFPLMKGVNCYVHSLMSMNLFMNTANVSKTLDIIPNYVSALFLFGCVSVVAALIFKLVYGRNRKVAFALLGCLFLGIYIWNSVTVIGKIDSACATKYAQYYLAH